MNERFKPPAQETEEKKPETKEKGNRPAQSDFAVTERTYFGRRDSDNYDYTFALEEGLIEEYTTPEGEQRIRYTEKFLKRYDTQVNNTNKVRKILETKTLANMFAAADRFTTEKTKKTYVPEKDPAKDAEDKPAEGQSVDKIFKSEFLKEESAKEATQTLWSFFEGKGLKDKVKDINCIRKDKNGGKKGTEPRFEVKIFLQSDRAYIFVEGTMKKIKEQLEVEIENPTKDW